MELWNKARSFAEEAAKRSHDLSFGASKLSKEFAAQASELSAQAIKRADQIKLLALADSATATAPSPPDDLDLEAFGITDHLREFVTGITVTTFRDFPLQDDTEFSDVPAVSNVRQDLTDWQEKHAKLVLSAVKITAFFRGAFIKRRASDIKINSSFTEISRLRYELCPRVMKERKFWRIYFILVNNHIAPYEKKYMEDAKLKSSEQVKDQTVMEPLEVELTSNQEVQEVKKETKTKTSTTEQDLDVFLLGDAGDSDNDQDNGNGGLDDDLDNLVESSDDEK
ncbi:hypothetical protein Ahy_A01g000259 isoform B [Arachis hypogaea]|uniref:BSD domain-containing protein n=1 Tax=Arachis hypogaea TaxID=3818 RepID=A0A445EJQ3_ARAHY|nr:hypothetical protein Ahy_A01g000259 isoform B [Arachis hypogaea]